MAAPLGFKTFATGDVLTAADTNGYLMQGVWVFANAAARDAAVTSPQEGNFCYLKDTNVTQYYTGSAWAAVGGTATTGLTFITGTSFSGVSSVSLPTSTFTSTYKNYAILITLTSTTGSGGTALSFRLRASGTDNTSANYNWARQFFYSTTLGGTANGSDTSFVMFEATAPARGDAFINLFAPQLTERTLFTAAGFLDQNGNTIIGGNASGTSTVTTSYDAITFYPSNGTITGRYEVYGYANS
jgi:hypothetical protein